MLTVKLFAFPEAFLSEVLSRWWCKVSNKTIWKWTMNFKTAYTQAWTMHVVYAIPKPNYETHRNLTKLSNVHSLQINSISVLC